MNNKKYDMKSYYEMHLKLRANHQKFIVNSMHGNKFIIDL